MKDLMNIIEKNRKVIDIIKKIYKEYFEKDMSLDTPITPFENYLLNRLAEKIYIDDNKEGGE